jgi:hypothetical protein
MKRTPREETFAEVGCDRRSAGYACAGPKVPMNALVLIGLSPAATLRERRRGGTHAMGTSNCDTWYPLGRSG